MKPIAHLLSMLLIAALSFSCDKSDDEKDAFNENKILKFILKDYSLRGIIDHDQNQISVHAGALVNLSEVKLIVVISDGATLSPPSGEYVNLTNPVSYRVTSETGNVRTYQVTAEKYCDTALLVVDLQNGYFPFYLDDSVVCRTRKMIDRARTADKKVIFIQTDYTSPVGDPDSPIGTWEYQVAEALGPLPDDIYVTKWGQNSFESSTKLAAVLRNNHLGSLVVCGIATQACVNGTIEGGLSMGFRIIVAGDAHSSYDPYAQQRIDSYNTNIWPEMGVDVINSDAIHF